MLLQGARCCAGSFSFQRLQVGGIFMYFMVESVNAQYSYPIYDDNGNESGAQAALRQMNLTVRPGEFVAVLGHNGSGKSTFARMINALIVPDQGMIKTCDMDTKEDEHLWDIRKKAGMVFQNPDNQIIASIVEEDVAFGPENLGFEPAHIIENVDNSIKAVQIEQFREASTNKLSGGQKQRVAVAGILAMEPEIIIMDEPTAMLDPMGRQEVMKTIEYLNKERHMTIVYITHHMDEAARADRIVVVDHGREIMSGTPREIFSQVEKMKELSLDVPDATELAYLLREEELPLDTHLMTVEELAEVLVPLLKSGKGEQYGHRSAGSVS